MAPRAKKQDVTPASGEVRAASPPAIPPGLPSSSAPGSIPISPAEDPVNTIASMAHEMKNSLVAIRTMVELVLEKEPQFELAQLVRREVVRVTDIVGQMIRQAGPPRKERQPIHLHTLLNHAVALLRPQAAGGRIEIKTHWDATQDLVCGDFHALEQIILNLGRNGIEAMPEGGTLTLETSVQAWIPPHLPTGSPPISAVVVAFQDTGTGISPENLSRLFQQQFTTKSTGSGIGLTLSQGIARSHGGLIHASSQLGRGSRFAVFLPLSQETSPARPA